MINEEEEEEIQKGLERLAEAKVEVAQMEIEVILSRLVALNLKSHRNVSVSQYLLNFSLQSFLEDQMRKLRDKNTKYLLTHTDKWYMNHRVTIMKLLYYPHEYNDLF
jgi:hypothetical protein